MKLVFHTWFLVVVMMLAGLVCARAQTDTNSVPPQSLAEVSG
jgi:hypothetical protein